MKIKALTLFGLSVALAVFLFSPFAYAQSYEEEYQNRIKSAGAVQAFSESPFGENVDLYTGEAQFTHVDLRLEGKGPAIVIARRSLRTEISGSNQMEYSGFGDWDLLVPEMTTLVPESKAVPSEGDWRTSDGAGLTTQRCTYLGNLVWSPPLNYYGRRTGGIDTTVWWNGYTLDIPGEGSQKILSRLAAAPGPSSGPYPGVTTQHWQIGCLASTSNGYSGEAFMALAPDGTKYFLSHLSFAPYQPLRFTDEVDPTDWTVQPRTFARMRAVRVEDRFGNYITYSYTNNQLSSISGSDGRSVTLAWSNGRVQSMTSNLRTWTYTYTAGGTLATVVLPDSSSWEFTGVAASAAYASAGTTGCFGNPHGIGYLDGNAPSPRTFIIKAPSGAQGSFSFSKRTMGQSYYPSTCTSQESNGQIINERESGNPFYLTHALQQRIVTGPGLISGTWSYTYEPEKASVERICTSTPCQSTIYTDVVGPSGVKNRYIHSTRFGALSGKLLRTEAYSASNVLIRSEQNTYNYAESDKPYPSTFGSSMWSAAPPYGAENLVVVRRTQITQQGRTFTWEVPAGCSGGLTGYCFDAFGRPTKTVKSSAL